MKRALIVEDIHQSRRWLADIIRRAFPSCEILEAANVVEGIAASCSPDIDLALIDIGLPDGCGLDVLRHLRTVSPDSCCVITTAVGDDAYIIAALSAGARGYLLKEQPAEVLSRQLIQLAEGIPALSPSIAQRIMDHFLMTGPTSACDETLTNREKETLSHIARGYRNCDVAEALGIAESTVASHIKTIYRKLGISSRAEASWHATRLGL